MKLLQFVGRHVHDSLRFDFRFDTQLTFLTGINGSGKTTAINCIVALIAPSLDILANIKFEYIHLDFEHDGSRGFVQARHIDDSTILLSTSASDDGIQFQRYVEDASIPPSRLEEAEAEYYKALSTHYSSHSVLRFISALPTPMFLGLDRRARFVAEDRRRALYRPTKLPRNVFGASLSRSLRDATELAQVHQRDALIAGARIGEDLRKDLILELLTVEPSEQLDTISFPKTSDRRALADMRRNVQDLHHVLGLPREEVQQRILPFLDLLERHIREIPISRQAQERFFEEHRPGDSLFQSLLAWSSNSPQLKKIEAMSRIVASYNTRRQELMAPSSQYLALVNRFLHDSGKNVIFDESGYLYYASINSQERHDMNTLSSGEGQIFVILTHLSFNQYAQGDTVFIIDEPEISLHVQWQELFVDSLIEANPNVQYVMATHSPSIILDRLKQCVDLNPFSVRSDK